MTRTLDAREPSLALDELHEHSTWFPQISAQARQQVRAGVFERAIPLGESLGRIRLARRRRSAERINSCACLVDCFKAGPTAYVDLEAASTFDLWDQRDIGQCRCLAEAEVTAPRVRREQRVEGVETRFNPRRAPRT